MASDVVVPALGESISEATVLEWLVNEGEAVTADQELVALETDKITVNVPAPSAGVLVKHIVAVGDDVEVGAVIAQIDPSATPSATASAPAASSSPAPAAAASAPVAPTPSAPAPPPASGSDSQGPPLMPAVRRLIAEHGLDAASIPGSGKGGRILKEDVLAFVAAKSSQSSAPQAAAPTGSQPSAPPAITPAPASERERIVPMSKLRRRIAENLVAAQHEAAMLTTFNEVDMSAVMALRKTYQEQFKARYEIKLGFTSFFVKAVIEGLKAFPAVNAEIRGETIVYKDYFNIGVAVGGGRGLVVPVIRDADRLGFAGVEQTLSELALRARSNKLTMDDLQGGTFTISNGGVYGSMLSTPILNRPQSGILGLHNIQQRPVAVDGQVVIRPMMYLALTYDHRIIDGREAVSFLVRVKEAIEDPQRILIEV